MDYATALFQLRQFLGCSWRQHSDPLKQIKLNFTLHSLKATLLSWGPQLHEIVTPEQRLSQGHHSDPNSSLATYSRDAVWTALTYQRKLISQVQQGWRPSIAQHRGSEAPMVEPLVILEKFVKQSQAFDFQWFNFSDPSAIDMHLDVTSSEDSSDTSTDSSSEDEPAGPQPKTAKLDLSTDVDEVLIGRCRSVIHALVQAQDGASWRPQWQGVALKPACGRQMKDFEAELIDRLDSNQHATLSTCSMQKDLAHLPVYEQIWIEPESVVETV